MGFTQEEKEQYRGPVLNIQSALSINDFCKLAYNNSASKGFWDKPRNKGEMLMLVVTELAECMEGTRKDKMDDHIPNEKMEHMEMADAAIRVFDYCGGHGIDLERLIRVKMAYNENRPFMHGKKC